MTRTTIADALRTIRHGTGLGQKKLAAKLEVSPPTVARCEHRGANPSWATITRYLGGCDATPLDLAVAMDSVPHRVMVANGDEVVAGEIEHAEDGVLMRLAGRVVMQAGSSRELLDRLPPEVSVYGLIR